MLSLIIFKERGALWAPFPTNVSFPFTCGIGAAKRRILTPEP